MEDFLWTIIAQFREIYTRIKHHFQFVNEFLLFREITNHVKYSINIYSHNTLNRVSFYIIANLFHPKTVDMCFGHSGYEGVPGIKDSNNEFNINGHSSRLIPVTEEELMLFASLYDPEGTPPLRARLPALHSRELINVLEKFAAQPRKLGDLHNEYFSTVMFDETYAQRDGTIRRHTQFPDNSEELILQGPHFFVGNPLYQTPQSECNTNRSYDVLDLTELPDDYLPRTNYVPACSREEYEGRTPKVPWDGKLVTEHYRMAFRRMFGPSAERSLIGAMFPKNNGHIHPVLSFIFKNEMGLITFSGLSCSIIFDFFLKTTGRTDVYESTLRTLPVPLQ